MKNSKHIAQDLEIHSARMPATAEQSLALEKVKQQAVDADTLLIKQSKSLLAATICALLLVASSAFHVVPGLLRGEVGITGFLLLISMLLQLLSAGYFLRAKDPVFASQTLKLILLLNGIILFLGLSLVGLVPLTVLIMIFMLVALSRMKQLQSLS